MLLRRTFLALAIATSSSPWLNAQSTEPAAPASGSTAHPAPLSSAPAPSPNPAVAPEGPVLTLEECITRALDRNFDLKIQHFGTEQAREDLTIAKADYDPAFSLSTTRYYQKEARGASTLTAGGEIVTGVPSSADGDSTRIGVSQRIPTGAVVSASGAIDRNKSTPARLLPNPAYDSDVSLTVSQPLLKNFGSRVNRAAIERARLGVDIAQLDFKSSVLTVVNSVETAYYNLAFAREQLAVRRFSLRVAEGLLSENRSRRETGVATDLDVLQAEVGVANARRNVLLAEQAVRDREDMLLAQIDPFAFNTPLGTVRLTDDPTLTLNGDVSYKLARENTPEYVAQLAIIRQFKIDSDVARQNRLPTLDVSGTVGYTAREDSYGRAGRKVWEGPGHNWQLDATLSFPWGLRAERARYRQTKSAVSREELRLQQIDQNILVQVRAAVRSVQTSQESVRISALATELSQRQYELEKARYDAGLSTFRRVQEAQDDLDNSRVNELQAKVNLRVAISDLQRLEGSSLPRYKINVQ